MRFYFKSSSCFFFFHLAKKGEEKIMERESEGMWHDFCVTSCTVSPLLPRNKD